MRLSVCFFALLSVFAAACGEDPVETPADSGVVTPPPDTGVAGHPDATTGEPDAVTGEPDATEGEDAADAGMMEEPDGGGTEPDGGMMMGRMSAGCGMAHATGETREMIDVDGQMREFLLTIPSTYDPSTPMPLVFGWHAAGGSGMGIRGMGVYEASGSSVITVHADGLRVGNTTGWVLDPAGIDAALYDAMFTFVTDSLCIDLDHVYSYGFSFGGYMSNMLGCIRGDQLLAIAPFHGGGPDASWTCQGTVSAMMHHRVDDGVVSIAAGRASRDHWVAANDCDINMSTAVAPAPCIEYTCNSTERVLWCESATGGHPPPPDLAARTWNFFSSFLP